jgi:hypothetical protein
MSMYLPANSCLIYQNLQNFAFLKFSWSCMIIVDLKRLSYLLFFFPSLFCFFCIQIVILAEVYIPLHHMVGKKLLQIASLCSYASFLE